MSAGMSVGLADELSRQYLNKAARLSSVHTLMDFFSNEKAKRALHNPRLDMAQVCLNYQTQRTNMRSVRAGLASQALSQGSRIAPVRPMMMGMASSRLFSSAVQTDSTDEEDGDSPKAKGRFFKFLEKAEKLDKKI